MVLDSNPIPPTQNVLVVPWHCPTSARGYQNHCHDPRPTTHGSLSISLSLFHNHSDILRKQLWRKSSRWTIPLNYSKQLQISHFILVLLLHSLSFLFSPFFILFFPLTSLIIFANFSCSKRRCSEELPRPLPSSSHNKVTCFFNVSSLSPLIFVGL